MMMETNHFDLNKFKDRRHEGYRMVLSKLKDLLAEESYYTYYTQRRAKVVQMNPPLALIQMRRRLELHTIPNPDLGKHSSFTAASLDSISILARPIIYANVESYFTTHPYRYALYNRSNQS
jgi:hypothetical protein